METKETIVVMDTTLGEIKLKLYNETPNLHFLYILYPITTNNDTRMYKLEANPITASSKKKISIKISITILLILFIYINYS